MSRWASRLRLHALLVLAALVSMRAPAQDLSWESASYGDVPPGAYAAIERPGRDVYLCRADFRGLHPGRLGDLFCHIGYGGDELRIPEYEVLVLNPTVTKLGWREGGSPNAWVQGGFEANRPLHVCRARHEGTWQPGKLVAGFCNFGYRGAEIRGAPFEMLTMLDAKGRPATVETREIMQAETRRLLELLGSRNTVFEAIKNFQRSGRSSVPVLAEVLERSIDPLVRRGAAQALGEIGIQTDEANAALVAALKPGVDRETRLAAAYAIGRVNPEAAAGELRRILTDLREDKQMRWLAAYALGEMKRADAATLDTLGTALLDSDAQTRWGAARALGQPGALSDTSLAVAAYEKLGVAVQPESDEDVRWRIAESMVAITTAFTQQLDALDVEGLTRRLAVLGEGLSALERHGIELAPKHGEIVDARDVLERALVATRNDPVAIMLHWVESNPIVAAVAAYLVSMTALWLVLLWLRPLALLQINEFLRPYTDFTLPAVLGGMRVPASTVLLVKFFHYNRRVLDAWVSARLGTAREHFAHRATVQARAIHVTVPVVLDGKTVAALGPGELRAIFARRRVRLLVWGEGGSGKTSLACQLARWAMSEVRDERLTPRPMLPVLIEQDLDSADGDELDALTDAIRAQLQELTDETGEVPKGLLRALLRQRRVLVIVDHLSEMNEATRERFSPGHPEFSVNALIVTSRTEELLDGVNRTEVRPLRVAGDRLSSFMEAYLAQRGQRELFTDSEFFHACGKLSEMVGKRDITVLLATLYADQMIARATRDAEGDLPASVVELMLQYLNELNVAVSEDAVDNRIVHAAAKTVAWGCLEDTFRPGSARLDAVLAALDGDDAEARLDYLERRLRLVTIVGAARDRVRFTLDPLAEYLAAMAVVEVNGANELAWRALFTRADAAPGSPVATRGFLVALKDCCTVTGADARVPDFVDAALAARIDPDAADRVA